MIIKMNDKVLKIKMWKNSYNYNGTEEWYCWNQFQKKKFFLDDESTDKKKFTRL